MRILYQKKHIWLKIVFISFMILTSFNKSFAQVHSIVIGIVKDAQNQPLPNVSITAKDLLTGKTTGVQSDSLGRFKLQTSSSGTYSFTARLIGFQSQTLSGYVLKPGETISISIKLDEERNNLNEVVVTGYSSQRKKDLTGAVGIINVSDSKSTPAAGIDQALQGRVPGVTVQSSSQPGGGVAVRIRGLSTINSNDPLYIIDGIPVTGNMNTLNPDDVESIQILKDASSASIYGARAANGVVIVTTRTAKKGKSQLIYDGRIGVQTPDNLPKLLDATQYGQLWFKALKNAGQSPPAGNPYGTGAEPIIPEFLDAARTIPSGNTDWSKEVFRPAIIQSHTVNFLNGGERGSTAFNVGYYDQKSNIKYSGFKRYSTRFNSDYSFFKRLKVGEFANIVYSQSKNVSENQALGSVINSIYSADPLLPVYDINGNFSGPVANSPIGGRNPLAAVYSDKDDLDTKWKVLGKVFADLNIIKGLNLSTNFAVDYTNFNSKDFNPTYSEGTLVNNTSNIAFSNSYTFVKTWTNTLTYATQIDKHNVDGLIGTELVSSTIQNLSASRSALPVNDSEGQQLNAGQLLPANSGTGFKNALWSQFIKVNYSYDNRYLASFTLRNDASSRLTKAKNAQLFPAFSLGWRLSSEPFLAALMKDVDELKLRYGWGQNGNQDIDNYALFSTYGGNLNNTYYDINGANNSAIPGYAQRRIGNPSLIWETTTQSNIGLDLTAFQGHFNFTVDYFKKTTKDLLVQPQLPATIGSARAPYINGGTMENKGVELAAGYTKSISTDLKFSLDGNFSYIKNKLTSLNGDLPFISSPVSNTLTRNQELQRSTVGMPIASFYGYKALGIFKSQAEVDAAPAQTGKAIGRLKFEDYTNDGIVNDDDRQFLGSPIPTFNYGINLKVNYRQFDLWAFVQGAGGNKIYNFTRVQSDFFSAPSLSNKSVKLLDAFDPQNNPGSNIPSLTTLSTNNDVRPSSYFIENGSYLRLKTLQIGFTPTKQKLMKNGGSLRVYVQAQNLFTKTQYTGIDPEVGLQNYGSDNRNLDVGVDRGIYPLSKSFIFGINLTL